MVLKPSGLTDSEAPRSQVMCLPPGRGLKPSLLGQCLSPLNCLPLLGSLWLSNPKTRSRMFLPCPSPSDLSHLLFRAMLLIIQNGKLSQFYPTDQPDIFWSLKYFSSSTCHTPVWSEHLGSHQFGICGSKNPSSRPGHTPPPELPMHFPDTCTGARSWPQFPRGCRAQVSLKTAVPVTPPAQHPATYTEPTRRHIELLSQPTPGTNVLGTNCSFGVNKATRCPPQNKCVRRDFTRDLSCFVNTDLDFDNPFSPGKELSLKKGMESQWP